MRYWIDTLALSCMEDALDKMKKAIARGDVLVTAETAMDVKAFRENTDWFEDCLKAGSIVIELWNDLDKMVRKDFQWSSYDGLITEPASDFEELMLNQLPEEDQTLNWVLCELINQYGKPRGTWTQGPFRGNQPLTEEEAKKLGVAVDAPRTEVLKACISQGIDFSTYNKKYVAGLMNQHLCNEVFG